MTSFHKIGQSLSLLKESGCLDKEALIKQQKESIFSQAEHIKSRWKTLNITEERLSSICSEVLEKQLNLQPEHDPGRACWSEINASVRNKDISTHQNGIPSVFLTTNGSTWDAIFIPDIVSKSTNYTQTIRRIKAVTSHSAPELKTITTAETKALPGSLPTRIITEPLSNSSEDTSPLLIKKIDSFAQFDEADFETTQKTTDIAKTIMISFHIKNPFQPLIRKVTLELTSVNENQNYKDRFKAAAFQADPAKHHEYRGVSNYYNYGFIELTNGNGKKERALLEIKLEIEKLRKRRKEFALIPQTAGIFPVMEECLAIVNGPASNHTPVVQRRLTLGLIKIHQQLSELGIPTYHAWIEKTRYCCDKGADLNKNEWIPKINHLRLIKYTSPENMAKLNPDGSVNGYTPNPSEDIWALGIIFYTLLWDGKMPDFIEQHRLIRDLAKIKPFDPIAFEEAKNTLTKSYFEFHANHCLEAKKEPLKQIVLDMLDPNPKSRITTQECLKRLKEYASTQNKAN